MFKNKLALLLGLVLSAVLYTSSTFAEEPTLVEIENNHYSDEQTYVRLILNADGTIWGMHYIQSSFSHPDSIDVERKISLQSMQNGNPTLRTESSLNIAVTKVHASSDFSPTAGGKFQLSLLKNVFNFRTLHLEVVNENGAWKVYSLERDGRHDVEKAYLNASLGGISSIVLYDTARNARTYVLGRDL